MANTTTPSAVLAQKLTGRQAMMCRAQSIVTANTTKNPAM
jgi:hypothetical protein